MGSVFCQIPVRADWLGFGKAKFSTQGCVKEVGV